MSDRPLLVTTTGEPFQPARLHYSVRDSQRLEACFRKLQCMGFDESRKRWVWHYDDEARTLKFKQSPSLWVQQRCSQSAARQK